MKSLNPAGKRKKNNFVECLEKSYRRMRLEGMTFLTKLSLDATVKM
jgi:hypothetical protein